MSIYSNTLAVICCSFLFNCFSLSAKTTLSTSTLVDAKVIKRVAPSYPIDMARNGYDGWTQLSYVIDKKGHVKNVLVQNSSGQHQFNKKAISAIKKWQFSPALENGKAVEQCQNLVQLDFKMNGAIKTTVSHQFKRLYSAAQKALQAKNIDTLNDLLTRLTKLKKIHAIEGYYLNLLHYDVAKLNHDKGQQLHFIEQAIAFNSSNEAKNNKRKLTLYNDAVSLNLALNHFESAQYYLHKMEKISTSSNMIKQYKLLDDRIDNVVHNNKMIPIKGKLRAEDTWSHYLSRPDFTIGQVSQGTINKLEIRCRNKHYVYNFEKNNDWHIPKNWQQCMVFIKGTANTQFTLVELPTKYKTTQNNVKSSTE